VMAVHQAPSPPWSFSPVTSVSCADNTYRLVARPLSDGRQG